MTPALAVRRKNIKNAAEDKKKPLLLRYLSVNSANPFNYFNFLLDRGDAVSPQSTVYSPQSLQKEATKLIHYFFLGITLPSSSFWVNLRPDSPDKITSTELSKTDLGRVLLEQGLRLKKDVSKLLHPHHPKGKEFWVRLYETIGKTKVKRAEITTSNRVWIVPDTAVVLETEDGALVVEARLKVLLENEYLNSKSEIRISKSETNSKSQFSKSQTDQLNLISESLMKEIILPELTQEVNTSPIYAPLRQIYHSLILAEWFKRKHKHSNSIYSLSINQSYIKGLESETPWEKDSFYQQYLKSYSEGEYKLEANLFGLRRMYWSGGIKLGLGSEVNPEFKMTIRPLSSSPLGEEEGIYKVFKNGIPGEIINSGVMEEGKLSIGELNLHIPIGIEKEIEAPLPLAYQPENQGLPESGASPLDEGDQSASSAVEAEYGGIDLSTIELSLKDEKFVSSLNPAGSKILQRWMGEPIFTLYPSDNADA